VGDERRTYPLLSAQAGFAGFQTRTGSGIENEGEALVEAFKTGQTFFTVVAWKAVPEMNGDRPEIVKQVVPRT